MVTAAVDAMKFRSPVKVGDLITLRATVNAAWRTSMEVGVRVEAETSPTGDAPPHVHGVPDDGRARRRREAAPLPAVRAADARRRTAATAAPATAASIRLSAPGELRRVTP